MREYLALKFLALENDVASNTVAYVGVSALINLMAKQFDGFATFLPLALMSIFWATDFVLGSAIAISNTYNKREGGWEPNRVAKSVGKWASWFAVLLIIYVLKQNLTLMPPVLSVPIEVVLWVVSLAIILAEATSTIRNAANLTGATWLSRIADSSEKARDKAVNKAVEQLEHLGEN